MKTNFFRTLVKQSLAATLVLGAIGAAHAGSSTSNLSVTASVGANCTISTTATAFGAYDSIVANATTPLIATGTVRTTCTTGSAATVTLDQGVSPTVGSSDTVPLRRMTNGSNNYLAYDLFTDSGRSLPFGNTAGTGQSANGIGTPVDTTVYGRVGSGQNVPVGSYTDLVIATVTF